MKSSTRRNFLHKSALITLGTAAATHGMALGDTPAETSLKSLDQDVAGVLRSYGRTNQMKEAGFERARLGSKTRRLPVSRLGVEVRDQETFRQSFEKMTQLSDRVLVDGNKVSFARGERFFVIENRVA